MKNTLIYQNYFHSTFWVEIKTNFLRERTKPRKWHLTDFFSFWYGGSIWWEKYKNKFLRAKRDFSHNGGIFKMAAIATKMTQKITQVGIKQ